MKFRYPTFFAVALIALLILGTETPLGATPTEHPSLRALETIRRDPKLQSQLAGIIRVGLGRAFGQESELPSPLDPLFQKPIPLFLTAKKSGEVRGCMGNLYPQHGSLVEEILAIVPKTLFRDPRHVPIGQNEISQLEFYVTAVGNPTPVERVDQVNPARDGILVRQGSKEGVVLPGEAKTLSYLLAFAKAKAGIGPGEPFRIYRLPTLSVKVKNQGAPW